MEKPKAVFVLVVTIILFFAGCIKLVEKQEIREVEKVKPENISELKVVLPFANGEKIPVKYTCDGADISPRIEIKDISKNAKSIVIIVEDPDAPSGTFTHWLIWNIPAKENVSLPENIPKERFIEKPIHAVQGKNDFGKFGYNGPCPPYGKHRYFFKIYVLDIKLNLTPEAKKQDLLKAMNNHVLQYKEIYGVYERVR